MCSTVEGIQCGGGTPSVWMWVCSTDQAHHQYRGGRSSVRMRVCRVLNVIHSIMDGSVFKHDRILEGIFPGFVHDPYRFPLIIKVSGCNYISMLKGSQQYLGKTTV